MQARYAAEVLRFICIVRQPGRPVIFGMYRFSQLKKELGTKIQPEVFLTEVFFKPPGVMDVRAFGSWMSAPTCLLFQDFEGLTKVFAPGRPPGCPRGRPQDVQPQNLLFGLLVHS